MTSLLVVTEGGPAVGLGHIRRCLSLATALRSLGLDVAFAIAGGQPAVEIAAAAKFDSMPLRDAGDAREVASAIGRSGAAAVLVDSYRATEEVLRACRPALTIAIDDLADRLLPADIVVNSAPGAGDLPYRDLTRAHLLLGPKYALLRPEFAGDVQRRTRAAIGRVLVTLGGGEHGGLTERVSEWLTQTLRDASIEVVAGPFSGSKQNLQNEHLVVLAQPDMREAMLRADIAVVAGGQTLFELAATRLPGIGIETGANQRRNLAGFQAAGTIIRAGAAGDADLPQRFVSALATLADAGVRETMGRGRELVDGRGAERTAAAVVKLMRAKGLIA